MNTDQANLLIFSTRIAHNEKEFAEWEEMERQGWCGLIDGNDYYYTTENGLALAIRTLKDNLK